MLVFFVYSSNELFQDDFLKKLVMVHIFEDHVPIKDNLTSIRVNASKKHINSKNMDCFDCEF